MTASRLSILLGADSLVGQRSGIARVTAQIGAGLRDHPAIAALGLIAGGRVHSPDLLDQPAADTAEEEDGPAGRVRVALARVPGIATLRRAAVRATLDAAARRMPAPVVYHEPNVIARPFGGVTVVAINDLSWRVDRAFHPAPRAAWLERRLPASLAQASRFVAISEFTAGEMADQLGLSRERIDVVPLAASPAFRPVAAATALARFGLHSGGFVLSVSTLEPRKNFDRLLAAHARLPDDLRARRALAIAGGQGWGEALGSAQADRARRSGALRLLGHVSDAELAALYSHCALFAFPSLYEGFGLPVIEAMACGAPVVASGTTAVGETAGDAAVLVDPLDPAGIAEGLRAVLEDTALAARLRAKGRARAAQFTWGRTLELLIASWRRALSG